MAFKFRVQDSVNTADGKSGEITFRDEGYNGAQDRYAVSLDEEGSEVVYYECEIEKQ